MSGNYLEVKEKNHSIVMLYLQTERTTCNPVYPCTKSAKQVLWYYKSNLFLQLNILFTKLSTICQVQLMSSYHSDCDVDAISFHLRESHLCTVSQNRAHLQHFKDSRWARGNGAQSV